jgi:hypothetical protein
MANKPKESSRDSIRWVLLCKVNMTATAESTRSPKTGACDATKIGPRLLRSGRVVGRAQCRATMLTSIREAHFAAEFLMLELSHARPLSNTSALPFKGKRNPPSNKPSPASALLGCTYQTRSFILASPSWSVTSCGDMAPGRSCLLAKTRRRQSRISRSFNIRCSSCLASSMRSWSAESMTKTRPWVPV